MSQFHMRLASFVAFQIWEGLVFCIAIIVGLTALHNEGLIVLDQLNTPLAISITLCMALIWWFTLRNLRLYSSRRLAVHGSETLRCILATFLVAGGLSILGALFLFPTNHAIFLRWFIGTALFFMLPTRWLCRAFLYAIRSQGRNLRFVAVVGTDDNAQKLAHRILANPYNGIRLIGLFDQSSSLPELPKKMGRVGTIDDLRSILAREPVDEVLITLSMAGRLQEILSVLDYCKRAGVPARVVNEFVSAPGMNPMVEYIDGIPSLMFSGLTSWGWQGQLKRLVDIVFAGSGLIIAAPILIAAAIAIKIDSKGPVLFSQLRAGKHKQRFRFYKFRTMVQDAEALQRDLETANEADGPVFKISNDPRVTRVGAFLRRTSIDELPQLFNIVRGEMSIVGPRPLPLRDVALFERDWHSRRFAVKPGLTCSWVIAGRSELDFDAWVRLDLDYIDNWSLWKDVQIFLKTIPRVLKGSGAY